MRVEKVKANYSVVNSTRCYTKCGRKEEPWLPSSFSTSKTTCLGRGEGCDG